jgi:hypothetical protein
MTNATDWDSFWNAFGGSNRDADAINVHVVKDYVDAGGVYNSFADLIVVERDVYTDIPAVSTLAHEIGHYFGLDHPHRNWDKGRCKQECVSRTREFEPFSGPVCFKTGKVCEKNGDALCDTPADPKLNESSRMSGCTYVGVVADNYGDSYSPDVANIMSYAPRECRTSFSQGQIGAMAYSMLYLRTIFQIVDVNETDPDQYEPDDSDFPGVPRPIALGESQCHSFYDMLSCQDPADWLIMSLSQGVIGSYQIKIEKVDDALNPVEKVRVWNIGNGGMRSTEVVTTSYTIGTTMIFEFPCSEPNLSELLIEVVRKSDVTEGKYKITLTSSIPLSISGGNILCPNTSYTISELPNGATANWTSSPSITLQNTSGSTVTIQNIMSGGSPYWIEATVTWGGCSQKIRKIFSYEGSGGVPDFSIVPVIPACFPEFGEYTISNPVNNISYLWSCQGWPCGNIQSFGNGLYTLVTPDGIGTMTLVVTATDECGSNRVKTLAVNVQRCKGKVTDIVITPNPTTGIINVEVQDTYLAEGNYHVMIVSQISGLEFQSDYSSKNFSINLGELQNGVFSILVYREDSSAAATFIINN